MSNVINIAYTDGSCHSKTKVGTWAGIIISEGQEEILKGTVHDTTHNRMELLAVIKVLEHVQNTELLNKPFTLYTDSQYVVGLKSRESGFVDKDFRTKKGEPIANVDLVKELLTLIDTVNPQFVKVKAHQKENGSRNLNREVDKIVRKMVRLSVN